MSRPILQQRRGRVTGNPTPTSRLRPLWKDDARIADCTLSLMQSQSKQYVDDRTSRDQFFRTVGWVSFAIASGVGVALAARRWRTSSEGIDEFGFAVGDEQAITVKAPLETVEEAWVEWCASGHAKLGNDYAVRFEPAPGARGTEVHLSGGARSGTIRDELRRFKQRLETGEILKSDGPGLLRPAQPRHPAQSDTLTEVP